MSEITEIIMLNFSDIEVFSMAVYFINYAKYVAKFGHLEHKRIQ